MSAAPTFWERFDELVARIRTEHTTSDALLIDVNQLEDLLGEWRDAIAAGDESVRPGGCT